MSRFVDGEAEAPRAHPRILSLDSAFSGRYQRMTFYTTATLYCYLSTKIQFLSPCQKLLSPPKHTTAMHTPKCTFLLKSDLFCGCINLSNGPPPKMNIIIIWGALSTQKHSSQLEIQYSRNGAGGKHRVILCCFWDKSIYPFNSPITQLI